MGARDPIESPDPSSGYAQDREPPWPQPENTVYNGQDPDSGIRAEVLLGCCKARGFPPTIET
jgi:hypothetical protein